MESNTLALSLCTVLVLLPVAFSAMAVDLDVPGQCDTNKILNYEPNAAFDVSTDGGVSVGTDCVVTFKATDTDSRCNKELSFCVLITDLNKTMCYVNAEFKSMSNAFILDCQTRTPSRTLWCVPAKDPLTLTLHQHAVKTYSKYGFTGKIFLQCTDTPDNVNVNKGALVEPIDDSDVVFADINAAVHTNRVIGIVVGVCLACMFLVALLITYFYYKNKAYTGVPRA